MNIINKYITKNPCYNRHKNMVVRGLMLHSVGCNQPSADIFYKLWNNENCYIGVHGVIDANNGNIYNTLPWNYAGWHGGGTSNNSYIGIEMCEPDCIKYVSGSNFTCSDKTRAKAMATRTYNAAVELFAHLCEIYKLNPLGDGVIISHKEGHKLGIASNHGDPEHLWKGLGLSYTMDKFRKDVEKAMNFPYEDSASTTNKANDSKMYTIRLGSYTVEKNAWNVVNAAKNKKLEAFVCKLDKYWKVFVGQFTTRNDATKMLPTVQNAGYKTATIVNIDPDDILVPDIVKGDKVKVLNNVTYDGKAFTLYHDVYDVIQVNGDRVVIGIGTAITAAIKKNNLEEVYDY